MAEGTVRAGGNMTNTFVLMNVPDLDDKHDYLTEYLMETLPDVKVHSLHFHPGVPDRVLVVLDKEIDLVVAKYVIYQVPLEDQYLRLQSADMMNAVIVEGDDLLQKLPLSSLKDYFQSKFGDGEEIVTYYVQIPQTLAIAVHFIDTEVTKKVLEHQIHMPLPTEGYTIQVKPFFANFHGLIPYKGQQFLHTLELEANLDSPQSEDSAIQERNEENQNKYNHYVENKSIKETTPEADLKWHVDTTPVHEDRNARERSTHKNMETNFHSLNYPTSEIYSRDNDGFSLQDAGMGSKFLSINTAKGESQCAETRSEPKSVGKKIPDRQVSSSDHQDAGMGSKFLSIDTAKGYTIRVKPFFANFHGLIPYKGQQFLHTLELEENLDSPQSEDSAIQERNEENQNTYNHYVENKSIKETTPEADLKWHVDTTPAHEDRNARERSTHKNMETNFHSLNYPTSEIYSRDNDGFSLQDAGMGSKFLSINTAKGESQRLETRSEPKSVGKKIPDRQVSSSDHQDAGMGSKFLSINTAKGESQRMETRSEPKSVGKKIPDRQVSSSDHQDAGMGSKFLSINTAKGESQRMETRSEPKSVGKKIPDRQVSSSDHQDAGMGSKFLSIDTAKGESQRAETRSEPKSVGKKIPDRQVSSSDHQTEMPVMKVIQSLSAMSIHSDRKVPQMAIGGNPEENTQRRSDEECQLVLNKALWKLMKDKIKKESNEVTYDDEKEVLLVKGKNVSLFMKSYAEIKNSVIECHIPLNEKQEMVLNSQYAKKYFTSVNYDAAYTIDRGYLDIYGFHGWSVNFTKQKVTEIIDNFEEINIPNNVSDDHFMWCKGHYEQFLPVHMSRDVNFVTIIGKSDAVREVKEHLDRRSIVRPQQDLERQLKQSSVQFSDTHYCLLMNFYGSDLDEALKGVRYARKPGQEGRVVIEFDGKLTDVKKAEEDLMTIQRSIQTEIIDVLAELGSTTNSLLIQRLSRPSENDPLFYRQGFFEFENKCIIKNDVKTETSSQARGPCQAHGRGPQTSLPFDVNLEKQKCSFRVCSSIQLEIKNYGDIVEEHSDVLVCFAPQSQRLTSTYVGRAFAKAIPRLEDKVNRLTFSDNKVVFTQITEMDFPPSPCIALAVMILPKHQHAKSFCQSVQEVLYKASNFGAHSVSFPTLGLGRTMKYSYDFISENFLSPLILQSSYLAGTSLTKITFLATNHELYEKMKTDASAIFTLISKSPERRGLDESFSVIEKQANGGYGVQEEKVEIQIVHRNPYKVASLWKPRLQNLIRRTHETPL